MKIHPTADVQTVNIGEGTIVWQYSIILPNAIIGNNCNINAHCFIENDVIIGNNVTIKCGVYVWDGMLIDDNVFIGPNVTFVNDLYPKSKKYPDKFLTTKIKQGVSIGAGSTILGCLEIGEFSMIGAGSVVTKNIPPYTLWFGNPAKNKGYVTKDGKIINFDLIDKDGNLYQIINNEPIIKK